MKDWIESARAGDFAAIPADLSFASGVKLAHLIDGYAVAGGTAECAAIANRISAELRETGKTAASALDLWIAYFGEHRRYRHFGHPPHKADAEPLDKLAQALRCALFRLSPRQKAGIMSIVQPKEAAV
jgi:hypothetical protein